MKTNALMKAKALKLTLFVSLLTLLGGCGAARRMYYATAYQLVRIPNEAMLPTIKVGDFAAIDEHYYAKNPVRRFDMVTFRLAPENVSAEMVEMDMNTIYLKRIVGLGGETLEIAGGKVYINGQALDEPYPTVPLDVRDKFGPVQIPKGEFFVMGDNRRNSLDSRYWRHPTLSAKYIIGKVIELFPR